MPFNAPDSAQVAESWKYFNKRMEEMGLKNLESIDLHAIQYAPAERVPRFGISEKYAKGRPAIIFQYLDEFGNRLDFYQARMIGDGEQIEPFDAPPTGLTREQHIKNLRRVYPKYISGREYDAYFPLLATGWMNQPVIYITEGIPKAIRACKAGLACISIQGKDLYKYKGSGVLVKGLERIIRSEALQRIVYIADSDAASKEDIRNSAIHLVGLLNGKRQSNDFAQFAILPDLPGLEKTGLDDYLNRRPDKDFLDYLPQWIRKWEGGSWSDLMTALNSRIKWIRGTNNYIIQDMRKVVSESAASLEVQPLLSSVSQLINPYSGKKVNNVNLRSTFGADSFRASCEGVDYWPGMPEELPDGRHNLWYDCAPDAIEGSVTPFLNLIEFTIPDAFERELVLKLVTHRIQTPQDVSPLILFLFGAEGTGKTCIATALFQAITSNPNYWYAGGIDFHYTHEDRHLFKQAVCMEEPTRSGMTNADMSATFKLLGDADELNVNPKGVQAYKIRNRMLLWINSNEYYVPASGDARRWLFAASNYRGDKELTKACWDWRKANPSFGSFLRYYLLSTYPKISAYDLQVAATQVKARNEVLSVNASPAIAEYEYFLEDLPAELVELGAIPVRIWRSMLPYRDKDEREMMSVYKIISTDYPRVIVNDNDQGNVKINGVMHKFRCTKRREQLKLNSGAATEILNKWANHPQIKQLLFKKY